MVEQPRAQILKQSLEPPADRSFVDLEDAADLGEWLAIEEIGREKVTFLHGKTLERDSDGAGQASEFCGNRCRLGLRRGSVESIEWRLAVRSPVVINMTLGKRGAKPAEERT